MNKLAVAQAKRRESSQEESSVEEEFAARMRIINDPNYSGFFERIRDRNHPKYERIPDPFYFDLFDMHPMIWWDYKYISELHDPSKCGICRMISEASGGGHHGT